MLVKDEEDIIEYTIRHLSEHVDRIYVRDNMSTDSTWDILLAMERTFGKPFINLDRDTEVGYWQSRKTTELAQKALRDGFSWVLPCDADECWYVSAEIERPLSRFLDGLAPDVHIVWGELYNHIPTALDDAEELNPFKRIGWRKRERGPLGKVACRLHPSLIIQAGNHMASYEGTALRTGGLTVRHFSWRTPEAYVRKIRNGFAAYAATDLPFDTGKHWRMWEDHSDENIINHFNTWFYALDPKVDSSLIYDPAPCK